MQITEEIIDEALHLDNQLCFPLYAAARKVVSHGETVETVTDFIWGAPKLLQMMTVAMKLDACSLEEKL